jgi:hypothetical protein
MKKVLLSLIVLGAFAAGYGYYLYNKPVESLERQKADVSVSASQLITDYEADEAKANESYLGKVVEVSGKIADITQDGGKNKIHLETGSPMSMVICELEGDQATESLAKGNDVKIKGQCTGYLSDVILVRASIVK